MNKKIFAILGLVIANQSFADIGATNGVPNAATCDSGALGSESGGVALQVQYVPETIALQWYDNNTLLDVTSTSSDSCTYNTSINLPTNPTKTGYKFTGWKVRPLYDFSTLSNIIYSGRYAKNDDNKCATTDLNAIDCSDNVFNDLNPMEWKISTDGYGTLYGMALCSITAGTVDNSVSSEVSSTPGTYCWCKLTGYIPNGESVKYSPSNNVPWIMDLWDSNDLEHTCSVGRCATRCSVNFYSIREMRRIMLGQSGS